MDRKTDRKIVLIIVDGFGIGPEDDGNAIYLANTPNWEMLQEKYPVIPVHASGNHVGLPEGIMGNSEVGHLTIGSGRITFQSLERINRAIKDKTLQDKPEISSLVSHLDKTEGALHLMGLVSDGKVHSDQDHLHRLIDIFLEKGVPRIYIHAFTDGRDTPVDSSVSYIARLEQKISSLSNVSLASVVGRYYAMDRDKKWQRTKIAYDLLTKREGLKTENVIETIKEKYAEGETDEFLKPIVIEEDAKIVDGDAILFFNFRPDRARQLTQAFNYGVDEFDTIDYENLYFLSMTKYDDTWNIPVLFGPKKISNTLAEVLSHNQVPQVHIAETEKYAHVTYFLNGGIEEQFPLEDRVLVPSPKIATYDLQPEMSTFSIVEKTIEAINKDMYPFIVINIACPDMVGHTGVLDATIKAVEATDKAFGQIFEACQDHGYVLMITADHGNAEKMLEDNAVHTAHTTNKVPLLITIPGLHLRDDGGLQNVSPTVLDLMGIKKPEDMTGESIILK